MQTQILFSRVFQVILYGEYSVCLLQLCGDGRSLVAIQYGDRERRPWQEGRRLGRRVTSRWQ